MNQTEHINSDQQQTGAADDARKPFSAFKWLRRSVLVFVTIVILGFAWFLSSVTKYADLDRDVHADAIVVLTGGFARLRPAAKLLQQERGKRLLISGVNRRTNDNSLKSVLNVVDALYDCCVDIDQDALDTIGNAVGTAHWVKSKDYSTIIVVTNDYHMPRSLLELRRELGDVELMPFAVSNNNVDATFSDVLDRYRVLILEYGKLIAAYGRGFVLNDGNSQNGIVAGSAAGW